MMRLEMLIATHAAASASFGQTLPTYPKDHKKFGSDTFEKGNHPSYGLRKRRCFEILTGGYLTRWKRQ
jgi:hypothetical protein